MGWNGSGAYSPTNGVHTGANLWQQAEAANRDIRADDMDGWVRDLKLALENCITRDGQNSPTANLPMNDLKHENVANATSDDQYAAWGQTKALVAVSITALTDAANITWDASAHNMAKVTLTADRTITISNTTEGGTYGLWVKQDATGGHTLTLSGTIDQGALPDDVGTGANEITLLSFVHAFDKMRLLGIRPGYDGS